MSDRARGTTAVDMHPLGGALIGTHADNMRHAIVRAHFMNIIQTDPRVRELFKKWSMRTKLGLRAAAVARAQRQVMLAGGVKTGLSILEDFADPALRRPAVEPHVRAFVVACERFFRELDPANRPALEPRPSAFVRDTLRLPHGWLAYELVDCFLRHLQRLAFGVTEVREYTVVAPRVLAPPVHFTFQTRDGESVEDAWARLLPELALLLHTFASVVRPPRGRRPNREAAYLAHWARWFYRARVQVPPSTVADLANDYLTHRVSAGEHISLNGARRAVQLGIRQADRLLSLGQYEI